MCLAVPMQVLRMEGSHALCRDRDGREALVDTLVTGPLAPGQWVLSFLGAAREVVDAERAAQVADALGALGALHGLMQGGLEKLGAGDTAAGADDDALQALIRAGFADLVDREPQLPDFLRAQAPDPSVQP